MPDDAHIREKARRLRREKRLTIDEIAERLARSRSTVYYWVRDLPIERDRKRQSAAQRRATARNVEKHRLLRRAAYHEGRGEFADLARDPTFRDFVCMYIGEGYKRSRNSVSVSNADPVVVSLCARWIERLAVNRVDYVVQFYADQGQERLRQFWGFRLGVAPERLRLYSKSNSGRLSGRTWRCRWGVVQVRVGDTALRARLQAWMDLMRTGWTCG